MESLQPRAMSIEKPTPHPAKFHPLILQTIKELLPPPPATILDPFAGVGRVHEFYPEYETLGVEIEPEWANQNWRTITGDVMDISTMQTIRRRPFDVVVTSPCYGNRMADHHDAQDGSYRTSYRHLLGRDLHPNNAGSLQWGPAYRDFHVRAWTEVLKVLKPGGRFILNISDHIRDKRVMRVTEFHRETLRDLGLVEKKVVWVPTPRLRMGANRLRMPYEAVILFIKE